MIERAPVDRERRDRLNVYFDFGVREVSGPPSIAELQEERSAEARQVERSGGILILTDACRCV